MKTFIYLSAIVSLILIPPDFAYANQNLRDEWKDLWTRCRISVETEQPIDQTNLILVEANSEVQKNEIEYSLNKWRLEMGRLIVEEETWAHEISEARRCRVEPDSSLKPLSEPEIALLVYEFLTERERLVFAGTHEYRELPSLYPGVLAALGLKETKPNGCDTISMISFLAHPKEYFSSVSGDQGGLIYCR